MTPFAGTTFETRQERGAREERVAIVAWLRKGGANIIASEVMKDLATAIESGVHLSPEGGL